MEQNSLLILTQFLVKAIRFFFKKKIDIILTIFLDLCMPSLVKSHAMLNLLCIMFQSLAKGSDDTRMQ